MPPPLDGVALLLPHLKARRPLLLAGAGTAAQLGYPLWDELVRRLAAEFAPALSLSDDHLANVDKIASLAANAGRAPDYFKWLDQTFCFSGAPRKDLRFHRRLVSLGFCGLTTLNFDPALEQACAAEYSHAGIHRCDAIDLTDDRPYRVYDFLQSLDHSPRYDGVLHLHGLHSAPRRLILGARSYENAYGHDLSTPAPELRTLLRKTIWTLFATRPVLFVGFSMRDPFFNRTLELLENDFTLTDEPAHFTIIPYDVDLAATTGVLDPTVAHEEEKQKIRGRLPRWLVPIFYYAPGLQDHSMLERLIEDLGTRAGTTPQKESAVDQLARRALQEL